MGEQTIPGADPIRASSGGSNLPRQPEVQNPNSSGGTRARRTVEADSATKAETGLRRAVVAIVADKEDERLEALSALDIAGSMTFTVEPHNNKGQIVVTSTEDLTPAMLQQLREANRKVSRS